MLPQHFIDAIKKIKNLEKHDRYQGAFIFGSAAREDITENSDLDIVVVINEDNLCTNVNHPHLNGIKLDITFRSLRQLELDTAQQEKNSRISMVAESNVIFDKNGVLTRLRETRRAVLPREYTSKDYPQLQFEIYHANDKVARNLKLSPDTSMLAMHLGINDLLKIHYKINRKWWVSSKRILQNLEEWDGKLASKLRKFLSSADVGEKFEAWSAIVTHIAGPVGGLGIKNCDCEKCKEDLHLLLSKR